MYSIFFILLLLAVSYVVKSSRVYFRAHGAGPYLGGIIYKAQDCRESERDRSVNEEPERSFLHFVAPEQREQGGGRTRKKTGPPKGQASGGAPLGSSVVKEPTTLEVRNKAKRTPCNECTSSSLVSSPVCLLGAADKHSLTDHPPPHSPPAAFVCSVFSQ